VCSGIAASVSVWQLCVVVFSVKMCPHMTGGKFYFTFGVCFTCVNTNYEASFVTSILGPERKGKG